MIPFYITANDWGCSSVYKPKVLPVEKIIDVPIFPLSAFLHYFPFDTHPIIDYIKIDAQSDDLVIIKSAEQYIIDHVIYVTLEAENFHHDGTVNSEIDIDTYMRSIGFILCISQPTVDPTYINSRYVDYINQNSVTIFQN